MIQLSLFFSQYLTSYLQLTKNMLQFFSHIFPNKVSLFIGGIDILAF